MSVLKDDGTKRLIDQILASLKVGKYAIMDKVLNINSKNPVENGVITQAINGVNNRIDNEVVKGRILKRSTGTSFETGKYTMLFYIPVGKKFTILETGVYDDITKDSGVISPVTTWKKYPAQGDSYKLDITIDTESDGNIVYVVLLEYEEEE